MLKDRKQLIEGNARTFHQQKRITENYGSFLRTLFGVGDWFVTLTFRDRHQDSRFTSENSTQTLGKNLHGGRHGLRRSMATITKISPDPRIASWEPDSRNRREPGPPVRDAALREIEHWLFEIGWEAAGHSRQEIFDRLAEGLSATERRGFARKISGGCLCCAVMNDPVTAAFFYELRGVATSAIGWVIAEEFGRAGGRWHVHLLIKGVERMHRTKWWNRAYQRFGRNRIEPIHG